MEAKEFGRFIAGMRKEKKMTQAELAEKIHVTDKAGSRWERGLGFPDIQTIEPLAQALGISVLELMRSERQEKAKEEAAPEIQYTQKEVAEMLQNAGDIEGLNIGRYIRQPERIEPPMEPHITLQGLEYLQENSLMKKAAAFAKGVKEIVPGI